MPPRTSTALTSSFSISDSKDEVVCPLKNQDGSNCHKRCLGEKRYRSMQEHIRRAHPEHYIPKLPATEESFLLMIHTPPSETRKLESSPAVNSKSQCPLTGAHSAAQLCTLLTSPQDLHDRLSYHPDDRSNPGTPRRDEVGHLQGAANAAAALAELGGVKSESASVEVDYPETNGHRIPRSSVELPPINIATGDITSDPYSTSNSHHRPRDILPSILGHSPPGRSSTLPPLQRPLGPSRQRKASVTKRGREVQQHRKKNSRGTAAEWLRRIQNDECRPGIDGRPHSAEPSGDFGSRWEDLVEAAGKAASMSGDPDEDRTPMPQSPVSQASAPRSSLPPLTSQPQLQTNHYQASPLQQALTPPSYNQDAIDPFPSVESGDSGGGEGFHMVPHGLSDSSPSYSSSHDTQIYCAACRGISRLKSSYACTECICGLCHACVGVLMQEHGARRKCPRCATIGGRFKPFQLDIR
ncbi:Transcription factor RfeD [Geosmithia morbida]|uniref:Transcription factor RfeD n=1 Tax=Geosmithia morbida TaxID=1094350 RepID=A0A9P4YYB8_9HYPO|nr:Transcription factor RfeD [Geosmithia morbida]KAF4124042.1 Transcription factor RfeD [Geosmithia morbida]